MSGAARSPIDSKLDIRSLLSLMPDALVVTNGGGRILFCNELVTDMFGYSSEELCDQPIEILLPPQYRHSHVRHRESYSASPHRRPMGQGLDLYAQHRDGTVFPVDVMLSPLQLPDGFVMIGAIRNRTAQKQAMDMLVLQTEALAQSNEELEQFAYIASHDLQEPLRMVGSYAQLLAKRYHGKLDRDADEFIAYMTDGASRMRTLINDLLAYSRSSRKPLQHQWLCGDDVVRTVLTDLQIRIHEAQALVTHDPLPRVWADRAQLTRVVQNLIENALKYHGPDSPTVHVSAARQKDEWVFSVRDNGIGLNPEHAERIFKIFQRLHSKDEYPGTGIGLAICKRIVERHGGRIWVQSLPGQGATFFFTLPFREEAS